MKLLIISFYYSPDLSAGSFRATALVDALCEILPAESQVDVVTTLPNRYHSFTADAPPQETDGMVRIMRIALPPHRSGMIDQSKAFLAFARAVRREIAGKRYDIVFATSSRLMTAALGAWVARSKGARLYLDIRDIFVDTAKDILSPLAAAAVTPAFSLLEKWTVRRASKVNLVSPGFSRYFTSRYPAQRFSYFTNGIDEEFIGGAPPYVRQSGKDGKQIVLYAGNVGEGQGLHEIIPPLATRMQSSLHFRIIGDGGRKTQLKEALSACGADNVELLAPVGRKQLMEFYREADVLFLHLNDHDAFRKVLPSKIFEYAALRKPIWAGISGYAAEFAAGEIDNVALFEPCDVDGAVASFSRLRFSDTPRDDFVTRYARRTISRQLARDIASLVDGA